MESIWKILEKGEYNYYFFQSIMKYIKQIKYNENYYLKF